MRTNKEVKSAQNMKPHPQLTGMRMMSGSTQEMNLEKAGIMNIAECRINIVAYTSYNDSETINL